MNMMHTLPDVPLAAAPWKLKGSGYLLAVRLPREVLDNHSFTPDSLQGTRKGKLAYLMFVDYAESDVGPYHELLYIPGSFRFNDGRHVSITRIYVSTWDSVVNGQNNWGIPKDRCDFDVHYGPDQDNIVLRTEDGTEFANLSFRTRRSPRLPVTTSLVPKKFLTLGQHMNGQQYTYSPSTRGHIKPAQLLHARFNPDYFPDISQGKVVSCVRVTDFSMVFPVAEISPI